MHKPCCRCVIPSIKHMCTLVLLVYYYVIDLHYLFFHIQQMVFR
jgi:hypothetical protein